MKEEGLHTLNVVPIFSYQNNEDCLDADDEIISGEDRKHSSDLMEKYIHSYNEHFNTKYALNDYALYKNDISMRMKKGLDRKPGESVEIDILLVVDMFLTGFDSKYVNTLYVDKRLQYHKLIQAFSRTNRICGQIKSHGNIVCYQTSKDKVDEAIKLFSDNNPQEDILMEPYENYIDKINEAIDKLKEVAPTVDSVDELYDENKKEFVCVFRDILRLSNIAETFSQFDFDDINIDIQEKNDYQSKYLDIYHEVRGGSIEPSSILNDIDFEAELTHRDFITVSYILDLIKTLGSPTEPDYEDNRCRIMNHLMSDGEMSKKKDLINAFIDQYTKSDIDIESSFDVYIKNEFLKRIKEISNRMDLDYNSFVKLIEQYEFDGTGFEYTNIKNVFLDKSLGFMDEKKNYDIIHREIMNIIDQFF